MVRDLYGAMRTRTLLTLLMVTSLTLTFCTPATDGNGLDPNAPATALEGGKEDDYLGTLSLEFDLVADVLVYLEGEDAELEGEARQWRARELGLEEMDLITGAVDQQIWAEWTDDDRTSDNAILLRQMSDSIDDIFESESGIFLFEYVVEVAGPSNLMERFPFGQDESGMYLEVTVGSGDDARTYKLRVSVSENTPDSYPEYMQMFEGGLEIAVHIGDDHHTDWKDIAQAESVYDELLQLGFEAPVENFDDLALDSGPFYRTIDVAGQTVNVFVSLYHAEMADDEHLELLIDAYRASARTADIVVYSGHAGRRLDYSGVVLHYGPRAAIPAAEFRDLELPEKYQLFVYAGCETYTGYSESLFAHPGKTTRNADVITTVNFSTSLPRATATITLLNGMIDDVDGTWWPHSWSSLLRQLNDADAGHRWTAMYGVHGLSDNPRVSPLGNVGTVGQACQVNSDCPGIDSQCNLRANNALQCGVACTDDSGCPTGSRCIDVGSNVVDELSQCLPDNG